MDIVKNKNKDKSGNDVAMDIVKNKDAAMEIIKNNKATSAMDIVKNKNKNKDKSGHDVAMDIVENKKETTAMDLIEKEEIGKVCQNLPTVAQMDMEIGPNLSQTYEFQNNQFEFTLLRLSRPNSFPVFIQLAPNQCCMNSIKLSLAKSLYFSGLDVWLGMSREPLTTDHVDQRSFDSEDMKIILDDIVDVTARNDIFYIWNLDGSIQFDYMQINAFHISLSLIQVSSIFFCFGCIFFVLSLLILCSCIRRRRQHNRKQQTNYKPVAQFPEKSV